MGMNMRASFDTRRSSRVMLRKPCFGVLAIAMMLGLPSATRAQTVTLTPSLTSPQKLGALVGWTATVQSPVSGHTYDYQFSVTFNGQKQIVRDFNVLDEFTWVPHTVEGAYQVSVAVRDITALPYTLLTPVSVNFTLLPWVTTPLAAGAVNPTTHPLVALFSAPPCLTGHQVLVRFHPATSSTSMTTNLVPCSPQSANFYVAGMYPSTEYMMHWEEYAGTSLVNTGTDLSFTTAALPSTFTPPTFKVNVPATADDAAYPVALFGTEPETATDLAGNIIWFGPSVTRMEPGGVFYAFPGGQGYFGEFDLAGNLLLLTNVEIMNEQLVAKGYPTILSFNGHEGRNLPNGNIAVLAYRDVVSTSAQGGTPTKPVDIIGGMILVLDHNMQLLWAWDSFAHQDINRAATLGDTCTQTAGGCTMFNPAFTVANDWLHANAIEGTADGNIIISERSQDWILKINYANGKGDGSVIWHLGAGGDFTVVNPPSQTCNSTTIPGNPNIIPWFTHQHDPSFPFQEDPSSGSFMLMTVFDDGNTRNAQCPAPQNSRGMVLLVNEAARQVYIETAADLGGYSFALGAAQTLTPPSGNVYASFDNGILPGGIAQSTEVNLAGQIVYQLQVNQANYRIYRMPNLYTPTEFETNVRVAGGLATNQAFDFSSGFAPYQEALQFNGNAALSGSSMELTDGGINEAGSAFYAAPVNVQTFTTDFTFQLTNANADGFTFAIQNVGPTALGASGGSLGYAGLGASVAIKFDLFSNRGEGPDSTGIYVDGAPPDLPAIDLSSSGINLHSGDKMDAHIAYDGTTLTLTITDLVTMASFSRPFTINIPAAVGSNTAYIGFTGGTGGTTAIQQILSWSYQPGQAINYPGFPSASGLTANGSASLSGSSMELTNGGLFEMGSVFSANPVNIQAFNTDFKFQIMNPAADGFTFTVQNMGPTAVGYDGSYLGYGGVADSVAVKFDIFQSLGDPSNDSTGIFVDGASPFGPTSIDLTGSGINLRSGDEMDATINYSGITLTLTITDMVTHASWSHPFVVNIPAIVGGNTAYVGFTGGTGGQSSTQQILNWTFE
jgi:Arylsulfotransferase (ASST)/Legume lectin domain/Bacterial lectin